MIYFILSKRRFYIVDDEIRTLDALSEVLTSLGANVRIAASAIEAIQILESYRPDVIVSDIAMSEEDRYSLITKIRIRDGQHDGNIPAIRLTACVKAEHSKQALTEGFQQHLAFATLFNS